MAGADKKFKEAKLIMPNGADEALAELLSSLPHSKATAMLQSAIKSVKDEPIKHITGHLDEMQKILEVYANSSLSLIDKIKGKKVTEYELGLKEIQTARKILVKNQTLQADEFEHHILSKVNYSKNNISN